MDRCCQVHPNLPEVLCFLPDRPHWEHDDGAGHRWPNVEVQAEQAAHAPQGLRGLARSAVPRQSVRLLAHARSEPVDPEPDSQAGAVLAHLISQPGAWTTGSDLVVLAGSGGAQRPGELARGGWPVESRLRPGTVDVWEHRIRTGPPPTPSVEPACLVVHCRRAPFQVYIGRPSKWGNPYRIGRDGDRDRVIDLYEEWLPTQPDLMAALHELRGMVLGCWCAPRRCHGDPLARLANARAA
jgi:uncharacterized protein DUF4326